MTFLERQLSDPMRWARIKQCFYWGLVAVVLAECVVTFGRPALSQVAPIEEPHFWFEGLGAWGSLYGFVSCVLIIVVSKLLGKAWLMRREDYYDR